MAREGEKVAGRWHFRGSGRTYVWYGGEWTSVYFRGEEIDGFTLTAPGYDGTDATRYPDKSQVRERVHESERDYRTPQGREDWRNLRDALRV